MRQGRHPFRNSDLFTTGRIVVISAERGHSVCFFLYLDHVAPRWGLTAVVFTGATSPFVNVTWEKRLDHQRQSFVKLVWSVIFVSWTSRCNSVAQAFSYALLPLGFNHNDCLSFYVFLLIKFHAFNLNIEVFFLVTDVLNRIKRCPERCQNAGSWLL